jgi:lipoprotein NlpI
MEEALAEDEESERWKRSDHLVRGLLLAFAGRNEDAWLALSACAVANPKSAHTALWLYTLAGDDSALDRAAQPGGWSAALVSAARGGLSWEDLMARAEATDHAQRRRERIGDVHLYQGVMAERRGDPAEAMRRYEAVVRQNCLREVGYWWAKWRLRG